MNKKTFNDSAVGEYTVTKRSNAKRVTLSISKNGRPNVTIPKYIPFSAGRKFIHDHTDWLARHKKVAPKIEIGDSIELYDGTIVSITESDNTKNSVLKRIGSIEIRLAQSDDLEYAHKKINELLANDSKSAVMPLISELIEQIEVTPAAVRFRATTSRWGSCSSQRKLTFSSYIAQLPIELIRYIVIHEMCHIKQMNHSAKFWDLVAQNDPNFKQHRKELKNHSLKPIMKVFRT